MAEPGLVALLGDLAIRLDQCTAIPGVVDMVKLYYVVGGFRVVRGYGDEVLRRWEGQFQWRFNP